MGLKTLPEDDLILTLEEVSDIFKVSTKTILKMLREEDLPARKIGREWRFSRQALFQWMANGHSQNYVNDENQVKDYFNRVAPQYNEQRRVVYGDALREIVFSQIKIAKDSIVADIGAGTGYLTLELAKKAKRVIAVDNSASMLTIARNEAAKAGFSNIEFLEGNAEELPIGPDTIDLVCANMLLHHVADPLQVFKEMHRILKPGGGQVIITDIAEHEHTWLRQEKSDLWLGFGKDDLNEWLSKAGFSNIKVKEAGCDCCTGANDGGKTVKIPTLLAIGQKELKNQTGGTNNGKDLQDCSTSRRRDRAGSGGGRSQSTQCGRSKIRVQIGPDPLRFWWRTLSAYRGSFTR
jgi:excisionase family DNA binding protein